MSTATIGLPPTESTGRFNGLFRKRSAKNLLLLMVASAWVIRLIVVAFTFRDTADPVRYYEQFGAEVGWIARSLALGRGFSSPFFPVTGPTALLPPLYPYLLSLIFKVFGVYTAKSAVVILSLNSLFSALTCIPIYLAARMSTTAKAAMLAGWAWAIYPFAIYYSAGRVWEFSLTSLLLTTCFYLALRLPSHNRPTAWMGFGLLYGIAALSNPAVLSLFPVFLLVALWNARKLGGQWLRGGLIAALCLIAVLTPWTIRNYRTFHIICPVRDAFGYEFWSANNGDTSNPTLEWTHPASNPVEMQLYRSSGEIAYIAQKRVLGVDYVSHHPIAFARLSLRRAAYYWTGFWSLDPVYVHSEPFQFPNVFFCTSLTLLLLVGGRSWLRSDPAAALPYLLPILIFPLTYYVSHPLMDYRQPIEPEIVVLVVVGLRALTVRLKSWVPALYEPGTAGGLSLGLAETAPGNAFIDNSDTASDVSMPAGV